MADTYSDDDPDSAAMAEAMGFTGFGMQRSNKKRKLTTPPSQTGANNAPLGKRRPLNLPRPVVSGSGAGGDDGGEEGNPEEIDLDGDDDEGDADAAGIQGNGGGGDADVVNERAVGALTVSDDAPSTAGPHQHHHPLPPRPQQQQQHHHHDANNASRRPGGRQGQGQAPWWEGEWDPRLVARMIENPWDRLEKQRGLEALGTWPASTARGGRGRAASRGGEGEDVSSSGGVGGAVGSLGEMVAEQTSAQTTVS